MRDKFVINGKFAFKTAKRPNITKEKSETIEKIQLERERERTVEFGGANLNKAVYFDGHISGINRG